MCFMNEFQIYSPKGLPIFDECRVRKWPIGSKIDSNQSIEENDNHNQGLLDLPTFIDNCAI